MAFKLTRGAFGVLALGWVFLALPAIAQDASKNLAPGFKERPAASRLIIVPADIELFSISAGGVPEPKADWTETAGNNFKAALAASKAQLGANVQQLELADLDELHEISALHGAVAQAIVLHHIPGFIKLPTKNGNLDWSMGDAVKPIKARTGADYVLFTWIRDSYASPERKAAMVAMAILGVGLAGGQQVGYASLVDLNDGRVVWFNDLRRVTGDLREAKPAQETVEALLKGFPAAR
ncbi:MAG: hypothetical protein V4757_20875 [Pseudomonadota bacterium]